MTRSDLQPILDQAAAALGALAPERAMKLYRAALLADPDGQAALHGLAQSLRALGRTAEADAVCQTALERHPTAAVLHAVQAEILNDWGRQEEALAAAQKAYALAPEDGDALAVLARLTEKAGDPDQARAILQTANLPVDLGAYPLMGNESLSQSWATALTLLGRLQREAGEPDAAIETLDRASMLAKNRHAKALTQTQRALALLAAGHLKEGFRAYDARFKTGLIPNLDPNQGQDGEKTQARLIIPWTGDDLAGRTLLLRCEQGMAETLQFFRLTQQITDRMSAGRIVLEAPPMLVPLLRASHLVSDVIAQGDPLPKADCWAPLLSVPRLLGIDDGTVPDEVPYLRVDPSLISDWRERLGPGPKIGIAWHGGEGAFEGVGRSIPLSAFAPLAAIPDTRLISLQKGEGRQEMDDVPFPVYDYGDSLDEGAGAFLDTAVVMQHCALIVTSNTAIAHLAGALGRPCWVVLPPGGDWRFGWHPTDSPWYPTIECLRRPANGTWQDVFDHIARRLNALRQGQLEEIEGDIAQQEAILETDDAASSPTATTKAPNQTPDH